MQKRSREVPMIPIDRIDVLNPRDRNRKVFDDMVGNIKAIGLKKPISVTPRRAPDGTERYLLICGEGRLKAYRALGATHIPALIDNISEEDAFIRSLVENIARVKRRPLEMLFGIQQLRDRGYSTKEISEKTGLNHGYVHGVLALLEQGEERLLVAVEKGRVPLTAAMTIAGAGNDDKAIQAALQEAYESGKLRGQRLHHARRIIENRKAHGPKLTRQPSRDKKGVTTSSLVRTYQKEVARQKLLVRKAEYTQHRLLIIVEALRQLFADENFANLLRAEGLHTLPKYLAEKVWPERSPS